MLDPGAYIGREQTYVKHFVLQAYLERVAFNIFSFRDRFAYVDGFSGPWKSENESFEDTSFKIAVDKLVRVKTAVNERPGKKAQFKCLFIEKAARPFADLQTAVSEFEHLEIVLVNGAFEDNVERICDFAKGSFSLIFIDPTGWQGFPMERIRPLLNLEGEVLINFMSDFINRFIADPRPEIAASFDDLYGPDWFPEWQKLYSSGLSREAAAIEVYTSRLKNAGNFQFVTSTRILKPTANRSYFYLIYATRHWKGIQEFRAVEKRTIDAQERIRGAAKLKARANSSGMNDMFGTAVDDPNISSYESERMRLLAQAKARLRDELKQNLLGIRYEHLLGNVLQTPMVWKSDLDAWISELHSSRLIEIVGISERQRIAKRGNVIKWLS